MIIEEEDIKGYLIDDQWVCLDCVEDEEAAEATPDQIVTPRALDMRNSRVFCDRKTNCSGSRIW